MMPNKGIFIVESPFQMISAIEAANSSYFAFDSTVLIILWSNENRNNHQMLKVSSLFKWDKVIKIRNIKFFRLPYTFLKLFNKKDLKNCTCFIGEPRNNFMLNICSLLKPKEYYYLDDGNISVEIQEKIREGIDFNTFSYSSSEQRFNKNNLKELSRRILFYFFGIKPLKNIPHWFTFFTLKNVKGQKIVNHKFQYLKEVYSKKIININNDNQLFFIGGNLSESGTIKESKEIELLKKVQEINSNFNFIYCAHRRESDSKLEKIKSSLKNVTIRKADYPLEVDFLNKGIHIKNLATFFSTAIYTLKEIHNPMFLVSYKVPYSDLEAFKESIIAVYSDMDKQGFEIIDIL